MRKVWQPLSYMNQGNIFVGERLLYNLCSHQPTVELAVGELANIFLQMVKNHDHSWLAAAHAVPSPTSFIYFPV